jgi:hypothetical protein
MVNKLKFRTDRFCLDDLLPGFQQMDRLLEQAIAAAQATYGVRHRVSREWDARVFILTIFSIFLLSEWLESLFYR